MQVNSCLDLSSLALEVTPASAGALRSALRSAATNVLLDAYAMAAKAYPGHARELRGEVARRIGTDEDSIAASSGRGWQMLQELGEMFEGAPSRHLKPEAEPAFRLALQNAPDADLVAALELAVKMGQTDLQTHFAAEVSRRIA